MLIMKCSHCDKYIKSELLVELSTIECEHCGTDVAVNNVLVSSNGFTFDRNDLLKRFFRYRKLLDEVIDERNALGENSSSSQESKRSIEQFLSILQGMMTGARDNFRCQFDRSVHVNLTCSGNHYRGSFINLSMEGACIEVPVANFLPRVGGSVAATFTLPESDTQLKIDAYFCWVKKARAGQERHHVIGLKFSRIDEEVKPLLWGFIARQAGHKPT